MALAVWGHPTPGGAQFTQGNGWRRARSLPDGAPRPEVDAAAEAMGRGGPLPPGWITFEPGEM